MSTEYFSSTDSPPSDSAEVTRLPPREASKAFVSASGVAPALSRMVLAAEGIIASAISRCSVATKLSPISSARVSAWARTRASGPLMAGWLTELPEVEGSLSMAWTAALSTTAGSAPTASSSAPTVLSGVSSSPCSRCSGSVLGFPFVRAWRTAAVTASRDLVVSLSVFMVCVLS